MTTTHKLDQCSPTSSSVVMTLMVLASRKTVGSHPGTTLSFAWATVASAINKANESIARLAIRQIFMFVRIVSMRLHLQSYSRPYTARDQIFPEPPAVEIAGRGLLNGVYTKEVLASPSWLRRSQYRLYCRLPGYMKPRHVAALSALLAISMVGCGSSNSNSCSNVTAATICAHS